MQYGDCERCVYDEYVGGDDMDIIIIHGGAFIVGDKNQQKDIAMLLSKTMKARVTVANYTLSSIDDYTLQTVLTLSLCVILILALVCKHHCLLLLVLILMAITTATLAYMARKKDSKDVFPIYLENIAQCIAKRKRADIPLFLLGHSAGAYIAAMVSINGKYLLPYGLSIADITGTILLSGVYSAAHLDDTLDIASLLRRSAFPSHSNLLYDFPLSGLCLLTDTDVSNMAPFFIASAQLDFTLVRHARDFVVALNDRDADVTWRTYASTTHFSIRKHWCDNEVNMQVRKDIEDFIQHARLRKEKWLQGANLNHDAYNILPSPQPSLQNYAQLI
jgi:acetyl esterase/lipase